MNPTEIPNSTELNGSSSTPDLSPQSSTSADDDKESVKALLAEARNTKMVLEDFKSAVDNGNFHGHQMLALAKGLAFITSVINQAKAHIENLQARLKS